MQFDVILEELFAAHPPLAELAERIASILYVEIPGMVPSDGWMFAKESARQNVEAILAPLYAENERLKTELRQAGDGIAKVALLSSMLKPRDFAALQAVTTRIEQVLDGKIEGPTIERLQAALARKDELLRECRGYVNEAVASAEYFAREAEYKSHASESRAEANVHRGLLARIDAALKPQEPPHAE